MSENASDSILCPGLNILRAGNVMYGHTLGAGDQDSLPAALSRCLRIRDERLVSYWLAQEHTCRVVESCSRDPGNTADGFILDTPGIVGIIRTADCTPLFVWDDHGDTVGLVHVGWRGLAGGILTNLLQLLEKRDVDFSQLNIWMGPAIEGACYPVGEELPAMFPGPSREFWGFSRLSGKGLTLDVRRGIKNVLRNAGIPESRIVNSRVCTFCEGKLPSYRRDGPDCGRILNFILRKP